jgi:ribosome biogenesis protein Nip4
LSYVVLMKMSEKASFEVNETHWKSMHIPSRGNLYDYTLMFCVCSNSLC